MGAIALTTTPCISTADHKNTRADAKVFNLIPVVKNNYRICISFNKDKTEVYYFLYGYPVTSTVKDIKER